MNRNQIDLFCERNGIVRYTHNADGSIDVDQHVTIYEDAKELPFAFNIVNGFFECRNETITSLVGAPVSCGSVFISRANGLTSLVGLPKKFSYLHMPDNIDMTPENFDILLKSDFLGIPGTSPLFDKNFNRYKNIKSLLE